MEKSLERAGGTNAIAFFESDGKHFHVNLQMDIITDDPTVQAGADIFADILSDAGVAWPDERPHYTVDRRKRRIRVLATWYNN